MAARGAGAAGQATDHWVPGLWHGCKWTGAFVQRLHELGWSEGRDVAIEYRWAEGRNERAAEIAAEFVRLKVDVIVTYGTQSILAAKQATTIIPIVFALPGDPVATGLVASLARPGGNATGFMSAPTPPASCLRQRHRLHVCGNATGFMSYEYSLAAKWLELLKEIAPVPRRNAALSARALVP